VAVAAVAQVSNTYEAQRAICSVVTTEQAIEFAITMVRRIL